MMTSAKVPPGTAIASTPGSVATCEYRSGVTSQIMSISLLLNAVSSVEGSGNTLMYAASRWGSPFR
jgi:hypothetical protein